MTTLTLWQWETLPWYAFGAYWAITALRVKPTKMTEPSAGRLATLVPIALALVLLFNNRLSLGPLRLRFIPSELWILWTGIVLTFFGSAIAIWARYCLGQYWSARVTLKEGHQLISAGPYAYVRHPIYTGMLLAVVGTALFIGAWRGILAVLLTLAAHSFKAAREEALLTREFGAQYEAYRRRTGFLFPRVGRSTVSQRPS